MMDPAQIQMMQQMGILGSHMGFPGMFQPVISSGVNALQQTAQTYAPSPTLTPGMPDTTPLAPFGLQNYGILGTGRACGECVFIKPNAAAGSYSYG